MEDLRDHGVHRYIVEKNSDVAVVEEILPEYEQNWDEYKNDKLKTRKLVVNELTKIF